MTSPSSARPDVVSFADEMLICVDVNDQVVGYASKAACHDGEGALHRAFSIFIFNDKGELLLQQRSAEKRLWPLWWANACCSHPRRGEQLEAAAHRRLGEELALSCPLILTHSFVYQAAYGSEGSEHELCSVFVGRSNVAPQVHPREVADVAWWAPKDLDAALAAPAGKYTPWLRMEWAALRRDHWHVVEQLLARVKEER